MNKNMLKKTMEKKEKERIIPPPKESKNPILNQTPVIKQSSDSTTFTNNSLFLHRRMQIVEGGRINTYLHKMVAETHKKLDSQNSI